MPEVEYTTRMNLEPEAIWDFVKDMNNWAPFLTGYQKHEVVSDTDSIWTRSNVKPLRSWTNRAPIGRSASFTYTADVRKPLCVWPSVRVA